MTFRKDPAKVSAYNKAYYAANRDRERARSAQFRLAHLEHYAELGRRWFAEHPGYKRAHYRKNPEREIARVTRYYQAHREVVLAKQAARRAASPTKSREYAAAYRRANPERVHRALLNWRRQHPGTHKIARRARLLGNGGSHTAQEWREKIALFAGCCVYCGEAKPLVRDHNVPLIRGGTNEISNILPACRSCNGEKHARTAREFLGLDEYKPMTGGRMLMTSAK